MHGSKGCFVQQVAGCRNLQIMLSNRWSLTWSERSSALVSCWIRIPRSAGPSPAGLLISTSSCFATLRLVLLLRPEALPTDCRTRSPSAVRAAGQRPQAETANSPLADSFPRFR